MGCATLDGPLLKQGFQRGEILSARSSGGDYASVSYLNGDREIEVHFRHSLGLVTYRLGSLKLGHEAYMRATTGPQGGNRYPGFSGERVEAFHSLAYDIETYAGAFLSGDADEFGKCVEIARKHEAKGGFARLAGSES